MDFNRLLEDFQRTYYTQPIMFCAELTAIITGLIYARKDTIARFFILYIAFDFCILLADWYQILNVVSSQFKSKFINITNVLIAFVEIIVYYYFFQRILVEKKIRHWIKYSLTFFALVTLGYMIAVAGSFIKRPGYTGYLIGAAEFLLLLPLCMAFYYQILKNVTGTSLKKRPSFWIVSGIFFYSFISIPYYLLVLYMAQNKSELRYVLEAALYYIPFTINFMFLTKAFLCKKPLTT